MLLNKYIWEDGRERALQTGKDIIFTKDELCWFYDPDQLASPGKKALQLRTFSLLKENNVVSWEVAHNIEISLEKPIAMTYVDSTRTYNNPDEVFYIFLCGDKFVFLSSYVILLTMWDPLKCAHVSESFRGHIKSMGAL